MHVRGSGSIIVGSNSFNQTPTVVTGLGYECQPDSPIPFNQTPTVVTGLGYECQPDSPIPFNQIPTVVTGSNYDCQPGSVLSFDSFLEPSTSSLIFQSYALSENTLENPYNDFFTLERFLKENTAIHSFEQLITSEKELAFQIIKDYFQKCVTTHEHLEPIQLILFVVVLTSSIFSQQFGGNRDLPVA